MFVSYCSCSRAHKSSRQAAAYNEPEVTIYVLQICVIYYWPGLSFRVQERERVQSVPKVSQEQFHLYLFTEVLFHQLSYYIRENESSSHRSLPSHQSKYFGIDSSTSNRGLMKGTFETHVIFLASCLLLKTYESICGRYARHPDPSADPYAFSPVMNHRGPW